MSRFSPTTVEGPDPDTCSERYEGIRIQAISGKPPRHVKLLDTEPFKASEFVGDVSKEKAEVDVVMNKTILTRRESFGPAPFIGDARHEEAGYFWYWWVDDYGDYIAWPSTLEYRQIPYNPGPRRGRVPRHLEVRERMNREW